MKYKMQQVLTGDWNEKCWNLSVNFSHNDKNWRNGIWLWKFQKYFSLKIIVKNESFSNLFNVFHKMRGNLVTTNH